MQAPLGPVLSFLLFSYSQTRVQPIHQARTSAAGGLAGLVAGPYVICAYIRHLGQFLPSCCSVIIKPRVQSIHQGGTSAAGGLTGLICRACMFSNSSLQISCFEEIFKSLLCWAKLSTYYLEEKDFSKFRVPNLKKHMRVLTEEIPRSPHSFLPFFTWTIF
jgi:hypothetical protein